VRAVRFEHDGAQPAPGVIEAIADADVVVIAPSNPIVSIGPIVSLPGVAAALAARRGSVVAVSPIVGGMALKGPADRMMRELGHDPSVAGVAALYTPLAGTLIVDPADASLAKAVESHAMRCVVTPSVMSSPDVGAALARAVLDAASVQ
jgi:LPPG:FO 2-phospho-L-lactate transferase